MIEQSNKDSSKIMSSWIRDERDDKNMKIFQFWGREFMSMSQKYEEKGGKFSFNTQHHFKAEQEMLRVVTISMICSILASNWKFQYFQRLIHNPVEHLWWSFYCKNSKPLSIFTKNSIVDADFSFTYTSSNVLFL